MTAPRHPLLAPCAALVGCALALLQMAPALASPSPLEKAASRPLGRLPLASLLLSQSNLAGAGCHRQAAGPHTALVDCAPTPHALAAPAASARLTGGPRDNAMPLSATQLSVGACSRDPVAMANCATPASASPPASTATPAGAENGATLSVGGLHDGNIFMLPAGSQPTQGGCRQDNGGFAQAALALNFGDKSVVPGQTPRSWTGSVQSAVMRTQYACNTRLNNTAANGSLSLLSPALGPFDLALTPSIRHHLAPFSEIGSGSIDVQTLTQLQGRAELRVTPDLRAIFDPSLALSRNTAANLKSSNYDHSTLGAGLGYFSPLGNSIAVVASVARIQGTATQIETLGASQTDLRINSRERKIEARLVYDPTVFTQINANIGYAMRRDLRAIPAAYGYLRYNYRGLVGDVSLGFTPGERFRFGVYAARKLASQTNVLINGTRTDMLTGTFSKLLGRDITLNGKAGFVWMHERSDQIATPGPVKTDRVFTAEAGIAKPIARHLDLILDFTHQSRLSGGINGPFTGNLAQIQLAYEFGAATCTRLLC